MIPLDRVVYLGLSVRLGLVVARNVAVPTRERADVGGGGGKVGGEAERGRERSTLATKKLFARILIPGGKSDSLPAPLRRKPGRPSQLRVTYERRPSLGKALVHADIVSSAILTCINSLEMATKM